MRISVFAWAIVLWAAGCGDEGTGGTDGGGGPGVDGGGPGVDGGGPGVDGGGPGVDGGEPGVDGGPVEPRPMVDRSDPMLHDFELDPSELDATAVDYLEMQYALLDTRAEPLGKLVFFLPGANNRPSNWRNHGRKLAEFGFHVVIPHYNNAWGSACSGMGGDCNANTRWEALTGEDVSSVIVASRADSAEGRVIRMLEHLVTAHPGGDWGFYLDGSGGLRYDRIIIAGISHGAASTGLYASRRTFFRAVMHSGGWWEVPATPATPIDLFYGLAHMDDSQYDGILSSWEGANMLGSPTSIDDASPPYGDARQLVTAAPNGYPHCSVCVSGDSPTDAMGNYLFEPAWRYMYGVAELSR
jgi:hypothetical protein